MNLTSELEKESEFAGNEEGISMRDTEEEWKRRWMNGRITNMIEKMEQRTVRAAWR